MKVLSELKYTKSHEWVKFEENGQVKIGISDFAQEQLGDLVFVNLPMENDSVEAGEPFTDVESVKAVAELYSPVSGVITAVNETLADEPEQLNSNPYEAWIITVSEVGDTVELLTADEYEEYCANNA